MTKKQKNNNDTDKSIDIPVTAMEAELNRSDEVEEGVDRDSKGTGKGSAAMSWFLGAMVVLMRLAVGGVFILSGFSKAIDPWGSFYKFNEYLLAFGMEELLGLSVVGAFVLAALEFMLGVCLVTGSCRRGVPFVCTLFMLFMTPLTYWLATTNAVPDCGCFGDMLVLSNWATFEKNLALLAGCIYLLFLNKRVPSVFGPAVHWVVMVLSVVYALALSFYGYVTQPLLDFRPYKVGVQLNSDAAPVSDDSYVFIYEKDGVQREFKLDSVPDEESGWEYVDRRMVAKADTADAGGVTIAAWDNGDDVSDVIVQSDTAMLILMPDLDKVNLAFTFLLNELNDHASAQGCNVMALTSASEEQIDAWNDITQAHYPIYAADDSHIKMLARGNPAVVFLVNGKVEWKRTLVSIDPDLIRSPVFPVSQFNDDYRPYAVLGTITALYLLMLCLLLVVNRTHVVIIKAVSLVRMAFGRKEKGVVADPSVSEDVIDYDDPAPEHDPDEGPVVIHTEDEPVDRD